MSPSFIEASLRRDAETASAVIDAVLPDGWPDDEARRRLKMRLDQMHLSPESAQWLLRAMVRREDGRMVGLINYHGPPNEMGQAELGYTVFEPYRRRGYASEAARAMMSWASREHGVVDFVLSISPANEPSLGLAASLGFRRVGTQMDEIDGEEWVFELVLDAPCPD
jgi:RimJ/RimL family protein N-acetyltransferase